MELLNIEIDQELPQEAIYHVLLLQTSITIWPVVNSEQLFLFCLPLKLLPGHGIHEGCPQYRHGEIFWGLPAFWGLLTKLRR